MELGRAKASRHRLLLLLDEFPSLGKLSFFETQLAYLAGYGIKAFLIAQSLNQLEKAYGPNSSILDNCHVRMTYAANDDRTAKRISDLVGLATHVKTQRSFSGGRAFGKVNESEQEHARPLLTPDEILRLPAEDVLLLVAGMPPYRARKLMYYLDERFRPRANLKPPDSPRERQLELLRDRRHSDWEGHSSAAATPAVEKAASDACTLSQCLAETAGAEANLGVAVQSFAGPGVVPPEAAAASDNTSPVAELDSGEALPL
jgi:type IV secretion system protein VirD4